MEVVPVFVRAAELLAWCVPKGATSRIMRLVERTLCVEATVAKTNDAQSVLITMSGRKSSEGGSTREAWPEFCRRTQRGSAG